MKAEHAVMLSTRSPKYHVCLSGGLSDGLHIDADVINFLRSCQAATGGFGGGPTQLPHLAPTYAATAALVTLGGVEALDIVNRAAMLDFISRLAMPPEQGGGFRVCQGLLPSLHEDSTLLLYPAPPKR